MATPLVIGHPLDHDALNGLQNSYDIMRRLQLSGVDFSQVLMRKGKRPAIFCNVDPRPVFGFEEMPATAQDANFYIIVSDVVLIWTPPES